MTGPSEHLFKAMEGTAEAEKQRIDGQVSEALGTLTLAMVELIHYVVASQDNDRTSRLLGLR